MRSWRFWSGPLLSALLFVAVLAFSHYVVQIPSPGMILLLGVTYATLAGGARAGLVSVALLSAMGLTGALLVQSHGNLPHVYVRIPIFTVCGVVLVTVIAILKRRVARAEMVQMRAERSVFEAILTNLHDAVLEVDFGGIRTVNPSFCRMTGFSRDELVGVRPPFPFWPAEEYARIATALETAMRGQALDFELVLSRKGGERFPVLLSVSRIVEPGAGARIVYTFRDITELKAAQRSLAASEARLKLALDAAGMSTFEWDLERRIAVPSAAVMKALGLSAGQSMPLEAMLAQLDLQERERAVRLLESGKPGEELNADFVLRRPDGGESWLQSRGRLIVDERGCRRLIGITVDVTDRRAIEDATRTNEARLRAVLNVAHIGTWDWDLRSGFVTGSDNLRALFGLPPGPATTHIDEYFPMIHPEDVERVRAAIDVSVRDGVPYHTEFRIRHTNGRVTWLAAHGGGISDEAGKAIRLLGATMDITDRRAAEDALTEHQKTLKRLAGSNIVGVLIAGPDGVYEANEAFLQMTGYTDEDVRSGRITWLTLTPEKYLPLDAVAVEELTRTGACRPFPKEYVRKDGSHVPVIVVAVEMSARPPRWLCLVVDQSKREAR